MPSCSTLNLSSVIFLSDGVGVNVTPDKRQVFVQEEKVLLATIKSSLRRIFDGGTASFDVNQKPLMQIKLSASTFVPRNYNGDSHGNEDLRCSQAKQDEKVSDQPASVVPTRTHVEKGKFPSLSSFKRKFSSVDQDVVEKPKEPSCKQVKLTSKFTRDKQASRVESKESVETDSGHVYAVPKIKRSENIGDGNERLARKTDIEIVKVKDDIISVSEPDDDNELSSQKDVQLEIDSERFDKTNQTLLGQVKDNSSNASCKTILVLPKLGNTEKQSQVSEMVRNRKETTVSFSMNKLKSVVTAPTRQKTGEVEARLFRAKIAPESNSSAEKELTKNISKDMFKRMEILGQFNLGFIIAKLDNDLFIIDQHASDEKFNFEDQQRNTTMKSQRLIFPQKLELTAANEAILMDNVEIFQKNGFDFEFDHNAEAMKKVKLVSLPISKN